VPRWREKLRNVPKKGSNVDDCCREAKGFDGQKALKERRCVVDELSKW
jgi:hypothetical protein